MKYRNTSTAKKAISLLATVAFLATTACGEEEQNGDTELDDSGGYLTVVVEPPLEVGSGQSFTIEVGFIDDDGDSIALQEVELEARLNQSEFSAGESVTTTDADGIARFEFAVEVAGADYQIEITADDENLEGASTTTHLFDVVAADVHRDNSTITADDVGIADGITPLEVTIELADQFGNPIHGVTPEFTASGEENQYGDCSESDEDGVAICEMISTNAGDKTLQITEPIEVTGDTVSFVDCHEEGEPFGGGNGSAEYPHRICAPHHLDVSELDHDIVFDAFVFYRDIDLADVEDFAPIGPEGSNERFGGTIDGNGFAVRNLTIDSPDSNSVALFGSIGEDGVIENLTLENMEFTGKEHVAAVATTNRGTITNTHVIGGTITADGRSGGFVATNEGTIADSSTSANVVNQGSITGGFAGNNTGIITDSYATGDVEGTLRTGGFVGSNSGTVDGAGAIEGCHATGDVVGADFTGGLVGWNDGDIRQSYATGDIQGEDRVAGLAGRHNEDGMIASSYSSGTVTGSSWVGGLVGLCYGSIMTSFSTADVEATGMAGGLVARTHEASVTESYAAGSVESSSTYTGALIGSNWETPVSASYWDQETTIVGSSDGGTGRTTAEFAEMDTFEDWDFNEIWTIGEAPDGVQRPIFQWQE